MTKEIVLESISGKAFINWIISAAYLNSLKKTLFWYICTIVLSYKKYKLQIEFLVKFQNFIILKY